MQGLIAYIVAMLMTLLPPRYRADARLRGPAMTCAILQVALCTFGLILRVIFFVAQHLGEDQPGLPRGALELINLKYGDAGVMLTGLSFFALVDFWIRPLNMILGYFVFEGVVRFAGALGGHQTLGTLPLYAISGVHGLLDRAKYKRDLGPLVADEVIRGGPKQGYDVKIYSCRPKLNWNPYMTVEFEGEFYQMFKEEPAQGPRRFIYYLRKNPVGRVVVVIDHYKPDDVLKQVADKWTGTPGLWDKVFPKWKFLPLVPDEVIRGKSARQDYDLKVYSCRRKHDWTTYVTIEFEDQWYQLFKEERGPEPRPYIYYLRKCAETRPAVVIRHYKPE